MQVIFNKQKKSFLSLSKGFTLIEVVVVMAIFLFIIGAAIGIFLSVVKNQKKVLAEQQLINQVSYIEEYMSKAMRTAAVDLDGVCIDNSGLTGDNSGYIYLLTEPDATDDNFFKGIRFFNQSTLECQEFFLENGILKELRGANGEAVLEENRDAEKIAITSLNLEISNIRFAINGKPGKVNDSYLCKEDADICGATNKMLLQPMVTIILEIKVPEDPESPLRTIQTTVSQRNLNVK